MASSTDSPAVAAAKVAAWRASGKMPPQGSYPVLTDAPAPHGQVEQKRLEPCDFLGDVVHLEPCTCGSSSMIAIHACNHEERKRRSGDPGLCVTSKVNLNKIRDKDVRASMQCCESCPLRCITPTDPAAAQ